MSLAAPLALKKRSPLLPAVADVMPLSLSTEALRDPALVPLPVRTTVYCCPDWKLKAVVLARFVVPPPLARKFSVWLPAGTVKQVAPIVPAATFEADAVVLLPVKTSVPPLADDAFTTRTCAVWLLVV